MSPRRLLLPLALVLAVSCPVRGDGPGDNRPEQVRPIPPKGTVTLAEADRSALQAGVDELGREIESLRGALKGRPNLRGLLPDVQVYHNAVRYALTYNEFYRPREVTAAKGLLERGRERARQLREGKAPWETATGLVVRGYVSKIDGSVQPYGLVVPASYRADTPHRFRLDVWCHGRGETLTELSFIDGRQSSPGEFTPPNAFVLHPYGRYCNANRFAGEIDLFEALEDVKRHYPIDDDRLVMRGFSMGGAACWQFAVHYPSMWVAAAPGAGFSETADFLKVFQNEPVQPTWYQKTLWHLYDSTDYALNLFNCPTVAYSGERDRQKQAADMMARALEKEGIELVHILGARAGHQYTPEARAEINRRIDAIVEAGRSRVPEQVCFTTWTLRYHRCFWVQVDGLEQHWERALVKADLYGTEDDGPQIETKNVSALTLAIPPGHCPLDIREQPDVEIDGDVVEAPRPRSDRSWTAHFRKVRGKWQSVASADDGTLRKRHGLQGPIDDAFLDSFLMVRPTRPALNDKVGRWAAAEMQHAIDHWRRQFRGEARVKSDQEVSDADIAAHNLILWGDPRSNAVLAKIADRLPVRWDQDGIHLGSQTYPPGHYVPVLIYPNPLNPQRYVVLNSGFTFREYDYLNNARQVPKLPDFAVVDVDVPVTSRAPGGIVTAGFFTETWDLPDVKDAAERASKP
ncbi:MAG TPA: prolyl oligopeptidase family serine peptidase [Isosphaeraceae bacterium]|nr:prolyl oligopeptidase family serine peptidase [Isosphaeraceae bacterium]